VNALLSLGYSAKWLAEQVLSLFALRDPVFLTWAGAGMLYGVGVLMLLVVRPALVGLERAQVVQLMKMPWTLSELLTGRRKRSEDPWVDRPVAVTADR
jgi:hypothetical protein